MTTTIADPSAAEASALSRGDRLKILLAGGLVLLLFEFATPYVGLIGIPVTFFLKKKLHLSAEAVAAFNAMTSVPLYLSFAFGFLRDRWTLRGGDRGILVGFGLLCAAFYAGLAFLPPSYPVLLAGVLITATAYQMAGSAARALTGAIGHRNGVTGQASTIVNLAALLPGVVSFALGGVLSDAISGRSAGAAARTLFLVGAGFMVAMALFGALGPRRLFELAAPERVSKSFFGDIRRLVGHWPLYPAILIYMIWQFGPAGGTALQYHLADDLHGSDSQVGLWYAAFSAGFIPMVFLYGLLCQRLKLSHLLWIGTAFAIPQFAPFLNFEAGGWTVGIRNMDDAILAALVMGVLGGVGQSAYMDLCIRVCPPGLQGTLMMLLITLYWIPYRLGDLWGSYLYHQQGGFQAAALATIAVYCLIVPLLLLVPRRFTNYADRPTV